MKSAPTALVAIALLVFAITTGTAAANDPQPETNSVVEVCRASLADAPNASTDPAVLAVSYQLQTAIRESTSSDFSAVVEAKLLESYPDVAVMPVDYSYQWIVDPETGELHYKCIRDSVFLVNDDPSDPIVVRVDVRTILN